MKKDIPLDLLKQIQPIIDTHRELIQPILKTDSLFHLIDNDTNSDFYFKINSSKSSGKLYIVWKPVNSRNTSISAHEGSIDDAINIFTLWIQVLKEYNNIKSIYDDPILTSYEKEFETEFRIVDENADYAPFNLEQQLFIDQYLEKVIITLTEHQNDENKDELNQLLLEVSHLKKQHPQLSKRSVISRLSKIWAKARKMGLNLLKDIYVESKKELIKYIVKGLIES